MEEEEAVRGFLLRTGSGKKLALYGKPFASWTNHIVVMACFSVRTLEDTVSLRVRSGEELVCKVTRSLVEFELRFSLLSYCGIRLVFEGDDRKQHVVSDFSIVGNSTVDYKVIFC